MPRKRHTPEQIIGKLREAGPASTWTPWGTTAATGCANSDEFGRWPKPAGRRGEGPAVAVDASPARK